MSTWNELGQLAEGVAQQAQIAVSWLPKKVEMVFLSEAQHQMQSRTGICKNTITIDLSTLNNDGSYAIPLGFKSIIKASYSTNTTPGTPSPQPIAPVNYNLFQQKVYAGVNLGAPLTTNPILPQQGVGFLLSAQFNKFWVYPFVGATGFLTIEYKPSLQAYTPSETVLWPGYGADPAAAMLVNGPQPEMQTVENGIYEYCAAQIFRISPLGLTRWRAEYVECMRIFEQSVGVLARSAPDFRVEQRPHYGNVGFRP